MEEELQEAEEKDEAEMDLEGKMIVEEGKLEKAEEWLEGTIVEEEREKAEESVA